MQNNYKNLAAEKTCFKIPDNPSCIERFITIPFFHFLSQNVNDCIKKRQNLKKLFTKTRKILI